MKGDYDINYRKYSSELYNSSIKNYFFSFLVNKKFDKKNNKIHKPIKIN